MILSIYKEEGDNLDMKCIVNNFIKNGDVKLENVQRWGKSKTYIWVQMTISLIYYRFIVLFSIGLEFLFIAFLLQFFPLQMFSLSISSSAIYFHHIYLSVYLKVVMQQVSVFSSLLFAVVMDVVPSEAKSGIPSELLYADGLVRMAPIMEPVGRRITLTLIIHEHLQLHASQYKQKAQHTSNTPRLKKHCF